MKNKLSEFLKSERDQKGLSLRDFAKLLNLSHGYLDKIEKGIDPRSNTPIVPTIDTFEKISKGLGITLIDLLIKTGYCEEENYINTENINIIDDHVLENVKEIIKSANPKIIIENKSTKGELKEINLNDLWNSLSEKEKNRLANEFIENYKLDSNENSIHIVFKSDFEEKNKYDAVIEKAKNKSISSEKLDKLIDIIDALVDDK